MERVIDTPQGRVRGRIDDGVAAFKGIPYAAAPFGANRLGPPRPADPWNGIRDALAFGPTAPQPPYRQPFDEILRNPVLPGEDCHNLNVWTPEPGSTRLPVMVWIHGGAFTNGSGAVPTYDGAAFARWNRLRHDQLPPRRGGLRPGRRGARQPRAARPGCGARVGPRVHRLVRRRPGQRHYLRGVCRCP